MSVTDQELFDAAITDPQADGPADITPTEPERLAPARDEHGRFVTAQETAQETAPAVEPEKVAEPVAEPAKEPVKAQEPDHRVPLRELLDERERRQNESAHRQRLEAQLAEFMAKRDQAKPPEFWDDPNAHLEHRLAPVRQNIDRSVNQVREDFSQLYANDKYGEEAVRAAYSEMEKVVQRFGPNHPDYIRVMQSSHPYGELVKWHQSNQTLAKVGGDLDAFLAKRDEELVNDPVFMAKIAEKLRANGGAVQAKSASNVQLPPSLNRAAAAMSRTAEDGDLSNDSLYRHAIG